MDSVMPYVLALVPTVGVATLFYFVIKSILEGDRASALPRPSGRGTEREKAEAQNSDS